VGAGAVTVEVVVGEYSVPIMEVTVIELYDVAERVVSTVVRVEIVLVADEIVVATF